MSNHPDTYHVLVTLPDVTGEEADELAGELDEHVAGLYAERRRHDAGDFPHGDELPSVDHLTPATLPARYSTVTIWTLNHIADWEGGVTVYTDHDELVKQVVSDFQDACERAGDDHITARLYEDDPEPANRSLESMSAYIHENGWKVHQYDVEQHVVTLARETVPA